MKNNFAKTNEEVKIMKKSGHICSLALKKVLENVKPGVTSLSLDKIAREEIKKQGAASSFMTVENYQYTICTTLNEQVVHGLPSERILKDGDILGIDIGALYKGYHSDLAISVAVGNINLQAKSFLEVGEKTLKLAINEAKLGNSVGDISYIISKSIENAGYSIVKNLTGHGIGRELHEEPMVPGFGKKGKGPKLVENMTLAIEVIYAQGSAEVGVEKDNWTITTTDGSLGGLFEQTVVIKKGGPIVLTPYL